MVSNQCFGSGWIRFQIAAWIRIRIRYPNLDPACQILLNKIKSFGKMWFFFTWNRIRIEKFAWIRIRNKRILFQRFVDIFVLQILYPGNETAEWYGEIMAEDNFRQKMTAVGTTFTVAYRAFTQPI